MQARRKQFKSGVGWGKFFPPQKLLGKQKKVRGEKVRDLPNNKFIFRGEGGRGREGTMSQFFIPVYQSRPKVRNCMTE
jgi:hypothetical protein